MMQDIKSNKIRLLQTASLDTKSQSGFRIENDYKKRRCIKTTI